MPGTKTEDQIARSLDKVLDLCNQMLELADHGDKFRLDAGCGIVFGTLRDSAYRIRHLTEKEIKTHLNQKKNIVQRRGNPI